MADRSSAPVAPCPLAVVGVSALMPQSLEVGAFWMNILEGRDLITEVPPTHWRVEDFYDPDPKAEDKTYCRRGGFLPEVSFDPMAFGVPPQAVPATDTAQLMALMVAKQVLEDASNGQFADLDRERISVILGVTSAQELVLEASARLQRPIWRSALVAAGLPEDQVDAICDDIANHYTPWQENTFPGLLGNVVAGRIANRFDLGGTNCITDAACASSFSALSMAANELYLGQSDLAIAGGVEALNDIFMFMCFSKTPALSPTEDCRPFSDAADGTIIGEGLAMLALRRLSDAERDGNPIYAVLKGIGSSSDGRAKSIYAPRPEGQAKAMRRAYTAAGHGPDTVELVEAHGTGTKAGDAAEFASLGMVFGETGRDERGWCALGSIKSQIGHTKAAAGGAGLAKIVLALHHKILPPTIKVDRPNPKLAIDESPFYLNTRARPWIRDDAYPRRASVSSFGFGGTNFHIACEEYLGSGLRAKRLATFPTHLVILTGASPGELAGDCRRVAGEVTEPGTLAYLARTSQASFDAGQPARLAVVAQDEADLARQLEQAAGLIEKDPDQGFALPNGLSYGYQTGPGRIAFLFPGQGSQYPNMGADVAMAFEAARGVWDRAANLSLDPSVRLHDVVFPRPAFTAEERARQRERLTATQWAQPAIGVASQALLALMTEIGVAPDCAAGHSFGELTALHAAGVLSETDLVRVARRRGELMNDAAAAPGAMTAVVGEIGAVQRILQDSGEHVVVANHNSPRQVVVSGELEAVEEVERRFTEEGMTAHRLPVATAFHSDIVAASTEPFRRFLEDIAFGSPSCNVYADSDATPYPHDPDEARRRLADQIARPVQFVGVIEAMVERGVRTFIEVGPGSVLTKLVDSCLEGRPHHAVNLDIKGKHGVTALWQGLGRLAVAGVPLALDRLWESYRPIEDPRGVEKPTFVMQISGANYGKPYPVVGEARSARRSSEEARSARRSALGARRSAQGDAEEVTDRQRQGVAAKVVVAAPKLAPGRAEPGAPRGQTQSGAPLSDGRAEPGAPRGQTQSGAPALAANAEWLAAYRELQEQTAQAHETFQRLYAESHITFLRSAEASLQHLGAALGGPMPSLERPEMGAGLPAPTPRIEAPPDSQPVVTSSWEPPTTGSWEAPVSASEPEPAFEAVPHTEAPPPAAAPSADLSALLLSVVADKTGYPQEMLQLEMELESDLGIDSIKRVEILSAMREAAPGLPEVATEELAGLRTLGQIVERMQASAPSVDASMAPDTPPPAASPAQTIDLQALLLSVVADKTGYPQEMLQMDMELESDLGIDSIKRVEILSAMREAAPELPEVATEELAELRTLGQIVARLGKAEGGRQTAEGRGEKAEGRREKAEGRGQTPAARPDVVLLRQVPVEVEAAVPGEASSMLAGSGLVALTDDRTGIARALAAKLVAAGREARVVDEIPADATAVICLDALAELPSVEQAVRVHEAALEAAHRVAARFEKQGGVFVTVQNTGGDFGLSGAEPLNAWTAGLPGLIKSAAQEWPEARLKAIDVERGERTAEAVADALWAELTAGGPELEVGLYADGRRTTVATAEAPTASAVEMATVEEGGVVVASGGARGVTAACLIELARRRPLRFVLLGRTVLEDEPAHCHGITGDAELKRVLMQAAQAEGRTPTPRELASEVRRVVGSRAIHHTLTALREAGSEAIYRAVDVTDGAAVEATLDDVRADWGPVSAVVHGAGVLADKRLTDKTLEQFHRVFDTKVLGLRALLDATREDPLRLLCLFSSVAGREGNVGQADYAMANEVLNKVAQVEARRRGATTLVKSLNWGPWESGMVTQALKLHFERRGVALLSLESGARLFADEVMSRPAEAVELVLGGSLTGPAEGADSHRVEQHLAVSVGADSHPFLKDHAIRGTVVVPVAMALEWFARAAEALHRDLHLVALHDVRVLRGIRLPVFEQQSSQFEVISRQLSGVNGSAVRAELELRGDGDVLHYSAVAELASDRPDAPRSPDFESMDGFEPPIPSRLYGRDDGRLFHGPAFEVIRSLHQVSSDGVLADLVGLDEMGWPADEWCTDPALVDGGLQLVWLWSRQEMEQPSLPGGIASLRVYRPGPVRETVRCLVRSQKRGDEANLSDLWFVAEDGRVIAEVRGLEGYLVPPSMRRPREPGRGGEARL